MKYMGIDASSTCTGVAIFEDDKLIYHGAIKPPKDLNWRERITVEGKEIENIIKQYRPSCIYMEDVPLMGKQMSTLVLLGAVQGYILSIAHHYNVPIHFLLPSQWRSDMGLFDGIKMGTKKDAMKEKAVLTANEKFGLNLRWVKPKSKLNEDDIAESILIAYSQIKKGV
jgi:Holliday junction resolvasome RuvABC endonuclease subunit